MTVRVICLLWLCALALLLCSCGREQTERAAAPAAAMGRAEEQAPPPAAPPGVFVVGDYPDGTPDEAKVFGRLVGGGVLYTATGVGLGYEGDIVVLVSVMSEMPEAPVEPDPVIQSMEIISCQDTPDFGDRVHEVLEGEERPWFQAQFNGKRLSDLVLDMESEGDRIAGITGATVTSEGAVEAARQALQQIIDRTGEVYGE